MTSLATQSPATAHCPHCGGALPAGWAVPEAGRCPMCRLVIGAGRSTATVTAAATRTGTAAGMLANDARRARGTPVAPALVTDALNAVAATLDCDVRRMRMLDYCQLSDGDPELPPMEVVLATFPTWKRARATAFEVRSEGEAGSRPAVG